MWPKATWFHFKMYIIILDLKMNLLKHLQTDEGLLSRNENPFNNDIQGQIENYVLEDISLIMFVKW